NLVTLGNSGNCIGDSFVVNYPVPVPPPAPPGNVFGTETEDPDYKLNPGPGFPNPMLDSVNVAHGATANGGNSIMRGNTSDTVVGNGPGGKGQIRRVASLDAPAFGWHGSHPTTGNPWATTQGGNFFRDYIVAYSQAFPRNYSTIARGDWTFIATGGANA